MKKILIFLFIFCISMTVVMAEQDDRFFAALRTCTPYSTAGALEVKGVSADYSSTILGWYGDRCEYEKKISFLGATICYKCLFAQKQLDELFNLMDNSEYVKEFSGENFDINNVETLKSNPIIKTWNNYFNDPTVCEVGIDGDILN